MHHKPTHKHSNADTWMEHACKKCIALDGERKWHKETKWIRTGYVCGCSVIMFNRLTVTTWWPRNREKVDCCAGMWGLTHDESHLSLEKEGMSSQNECDDDYLTKICPVCDRCYLFPSLVPSNVTYYLTDCGHILCDQCFEECFSAFAGICLHCEKKLTPFRKITPVVPDPIFYQHTQEYTQFAEDELDKAVTLDWELSTSPTVSITSTTSWSEGLNDETSETSNEAGLSC